MKVCGLPNKAQDHLLNITGSMDLIMITMLMLKLSVSNTEILDFFQAAAAAFLSQPNPGKFSAPSFTDLASSMSPVGNGNNISSMIGNGINGHNISGSNVNGNALSNSLNSSGGMSQSPFGTGMFGLNGYNTNNSEMQRLKDELMINKAKVAQWEDGIAQARNVSSLQLRAFYYPVIFVWNFDECICKEP